MLTLNVPAVTRHYQMAEMCRMAYRHRATLKAHETEGLIKYVDDEIWIALRGTEVKGPDQATWWSRRKSTLIDAINDIRAIPYKDEQIGWVHRGFAIGMGGGALGFARKFANEYLPAKIPRVKIRITGHSKGGGEAQILAAKLKALGFNVVEVVVFGSPRALLRSSVDKLRGIAVHYYRHGSDAVTTLPRGWIFPYKFAYEVGFGHLHQLNGIFKFEERTWGDHSIVKYSTAIKRWLR